MTLTNHWNVRHEDKTANGQRWYCPVCTSRYKTGSGMLVEIMTEDNVALYTRARFPPHDIQDIKFRAVEEGATKSGNVVTPESLLAAIPEAIPLSRQLLTKIEHTTGSFTYCAEAMESLPEFNWDILYQIPKHLRNRGDTTRPAPPELEPMQVHIEKTEDPTDRELAALSTMRYPRLRGAYTS